MSAAVLSHIESAYLPNFIASTKAIFQTMLGWDVTVASVNKHNEFQPGRDVTGIIGLAGAMKGTIVVSVDKEVAFAAAEVFIGVRPTSIDSDVLDLLGELANMIGGGAKERFDNPKIVLGLPTTVSGGDYRVTFNAGAEIETVEFNSPFGIFSIQIAIQA